MKTQRGRVLSAALVLSLVAGASAGARAAEKFPFDQELMLDTAPMRGSKRVPMLDIAPNGAVMIDLWCNTVEGENRKIKRLFSLSATISPARQAVNRAVFGENSSLPMMI